MGVPEQAVEPKNHLILNALRRHTSPPSPPALFDAQKWLYFAKRSPRAPAGEPVLICHAEVATGGPPEVVTPSSVTAAVRG